MCGILVLLSNKSNIDILHSIQLLKRLEYRGYDSAGIMYLDNSNCQESKRNKIQLHKKKGKINNLNSLISNLTKLSQNNTNPITTNFLMSHTRWATHGEPSDKNSHPHVSMNGQFYLVHNGIIENYLILKDILLEAGYEFYSQTDTEVLVNFIEYISNLNPKNSLEKNISIALSRVNGTYGLVIYNIDNPDLVYVVKKSSPIVIGLLEDKIYISSDYYSFLEYTQDVIHLEEGQIATFHLSNLKYQIKSMDSLQVIAPEIQRLDIKLDEIEKSVFEHFMLKEIMNQQHSIRDSLRGRINFNHQVKLGGLEIEYQEKPLIHHLSQAQKIILVACGTSLHAGMIGKYIMEELADIPVEVEQASEFRYRHKSIPPNTVIIGISQSGETADTLEAIKSLKNQCLCLGICNVVASSLSHITQGGVYLHV